MSDAPDPHVQAGIEAARAVFDLGPSASPMQRAYEHIRQADALLHDVINGEGPEDERWHASEAHGLIHDAAAHLSPEPEIREIARKEAAEREAGRLAVQPEGAAS